jgi:hypothetical protein
MTTFDDRLNDLLSEAIADAGPDLTGRIEHDADVYLELLMRTDRAHLRTGEMLRAAVLAARRAGHSWEAIGSSLGMSRQAAQQRFGKGTQDDVDEGPERRKLTGLHASNEMAALEGAGRYGWHSVNYGPLFHILERDDVQWEHRRVYAWSRRRQQLGSEGWQKIGSGWFPWAYYARPTGTPAETGEPNWTELVDAYLTTYPKLWNLSS